MTRWLKFGLLILLSSGLPAYCAVARVQSVNGGNCFGGTVCSAPAFGSNVTTGNTLVACAQWAAGSTGNSLSSVTDTIGNSFTVITASKQTAASTNALEIGVECGYAKNVTGGADTVTCNFAISPNVNLCSAWELSGASSTAPFDQQAVATGSSTSPSTGSVTTSTNGEFGIVSELIDDSLGSNGTATAGSGWTLRLNAGGGSYEEATEDQAQTSSGTITGNMTVTNTGTWVINMVIFTPGGGGATASTGRIYFTKQAVNRAATYFIDTFLRPVWLPQPEIAFMTLKSRFAYLRHFLGLQKKWTLAEWKTLEGSLVFEPPVTERQIHEYCELNR